MLAERAAKRSKYLDGCLIVPHAPRATRPRKQGLVLEVEFEHQDYLLAEPLWVRCSLVNDSPQPITLPYGRTEDEGTILFDIRGTDGQQAPRQAFLRDTGGPQPVTIPAGYRLVEMYNLFDEYGISDPGAYKIKVHYESDGRSFSASEVTWRKDLWKGSLELSLKDARIASPTKTADKAALRTIRGQSEDRSPEGASDFPFQYVFHDRDTRRAIIGRHGDSRYAGYARYFEALTALEEYEEAGDGVSLAKPAVALLEAIDADRYPPLFREHCLFHLVQAHAVASPKNKVDAPARKFLRKFPGSPLNPSLERLIKQG
jgi:hypothetical protein